jgi:quinol-cytochrome oxidoreductase complex cytochrome b subunit
LPHVIGGCVDAGVKGADVISERTPSAKFSGIGESIERLMRGGTEMGTFTISRFFVAHVFLIPAFIFALVASHIFLFRKAGAPSETITGP